MAFKGEIRVGMLNTLMKSKGVNDGDKYRLQDSGNLWPTNRPVKEGDVVVWNAYYHDWLYAVNDNYIIPEAADKIAARVLYKKGATGTSIPYKDGYEVGKYYQLDDSTTIWECTSLGDEADDPRLITFQKSLGLLDIINTIIDALNA